MNSLMLHTRRLMKSTVPTANENCTQITICIRTKIATSINPLGQVVAGLQCCPYLIRVHALVLGQVFGILPLKELDTILGNCLTSKGTGRGLLILGLTES